MSQKLKRGFTVNLDDLLDTVWACKFLFSLFTNQTICLDKCQKTREGALSNLIVLNTTTAVIATFLLKQISLFRAFDY